MGHSTGNFCSFQFPLHIYLVFTVICVLEKYCHAQEVPVTIHTCHNYTNLVYYYEIEFPPEVMHNIAKTRFRLQRQDLDLGCNNRLSASSTIGNGLDSKSQITFKFDPSGMLKYGLNSFRVDEYCVQTYDGNSISVRICNPCPTKSSAVELGTAICIPKCCAGFSQVYDASNSCVQPGNVNSLLPASVDCHESSVLKCFEMYKNDSSEEMVEACAKKNIRAWSNADERLYFYGGHQSLTCTGPTLLSSLEERFALLSNGSVAVYLHEHESSLVLSNNFCFDHELYNGKLNTMILACLPQWVLNTPDKKEMISIFPDAVVQKEQSVVDSKMRKCKDAAIPDIISMPANVMLHGNNAWFKLNETVELSCRTELYTIEFEDKVIVHEFGANNTYFTKEGVVLIHSDFYQVEDYCIARYNDQLQFITIQVCKVACARATSTDSSTAVTCIPKCCPWGKHIDKESFECTVAKSGDVWAPIFRDDAKPARIHYKAGLSCPQHHYYSSADDPRPFDVLENGSILVLADGEEIPIEQDYCLDGEYVNGYLKTQALGVCAEGESEDSYQRGVSYAYAPLMLASAFFLLITVIVYTLIWDKHNIHGWTVYALSISMFFMLVFLATGHILTLQKYENELSGNSSCVAVGLLTHFFFLSSFCWMTTLNFDLWWTFKKLTPASNKSKGWTRFGLYVLFCLGVPFFVVLIAVILDNVYEPTSDTDIILPQYGIWNCFLEHTAQGYYLYYLIAFLLLVNLSVFGNTIFIMYNYQKNTKAVRRGKAGSQSQAQLFAKLFFVMGVSWTFEFVSWYFTNKKNNSPIWIIFDLVNLAQGFAIFFIFVCKPQVVMHLWHKYPALRPFLAPLTKLSCCKFSTMDMDSREISGTKVTSTNNSGSLRQYSVNPTASIATNSTSTV